MLGANLVLLLYGDVSLVDATSWHRYICRILYICSHCCFSILYVCSSFMEEIKIIIIIIKTDNDKQANYL